MAPTPPNHPANDANDQLRRRANRRLLGASLLLLAAIIAVPMFLERDPPPLPDTVDVRIPPVEGTRLDPQFPASNKNSGRVTVAEAPAISEPSDASASVTAPGAAPRPSAPLPPAVTKPAPKAAEKPAPKAAEKPAEKAPAKAAPKAAEKSAEKAPPKAAEKPAEKAAPKAAEKTPAKPAEKAPAKASSEPAPPKTKSGQFVVQLIAVRDADAAKAVADRSRALRMPTYSERITVHNGVVTRVRVGPYDTRQQAENARARLAQQGLEAKVLTLP